MSSTRRPIVLIPGRFTETSAALRLRGEVNARALIEAVYAAGGEPLTMHPSAPGAVADDAEVRERLRIADAVLLPGGGDVSARWFGQEPHEKLYDVDEEQDAFDLAVTRVALADGIPVMAICRGLQVVNVARGGTLVQDMNSILGDGSSHWQHSHAPKVDAGTALADIVGEQPPVSCWHHQCLDQLGEGMSVIARSESGIIEAVDIAGIPGWFMGLQWHPEDTWTTDPVQLKPFEAFVAAGREFRE